MRTSKLSWTIISICALGFFLYIGYYLYHSQTLTIHPSTPKPPLLISLPEVSKEVTYTQLSLSDLQKCNRNVKTYDIAKEYEKARNAEEIEKVKLKVKTINNLKELEDGWVCCLDSYKGKLYIQQFVEVSPVKQELYSLHIKKITNGVLIDCRNDAPFVIISESELYKPLPIIGEFK